MPRIKTMIQLIEILVRLKKGESIRNIKKETGTHREVIRKVKEISVRKEWLIPSAALPDESEMAKAYNEGGKVEKKPHILDFHIDQLKKYREDHKSFVVIHNLVKEFTGCSDISETTVRRYIHRNIHDDPISVMIRPIEDAVMEVDFGYLGLMYDSMECRSRKAWVFSGRLRKSRKAYREVVYDQKSKTFFKCHIRAFHYFGGIPKKVVPDNLKAAVVKAAFYDPVINHSYQDLARHYDFVISPCLPGKPNHKGGVENDIKYIKNNFWSYFIEKQLQKGHTVPLKADVEESLTKWVEDTADTRIIKGVGASPIELFTEESGTLSRLPLEDWNLTDWKMCKVRPEWLIQYDSAYYSVPYKYIGEDVMVCADSRTVKVFHKYELIAIHERALKKWDYRRNKLHAPPYKEEYLSETSESLIAWAGSIGKSTLEVIESIFSHKNIDGLHPARALLHLSKKYSKLRLEAACSRAIFYDTPNYMSVKSILDKGLDRIDFTAKETSEKNYLPFKFARDSNYFKF